MPSTNLTSPITWSGGFDCNTIISDPYNDYNPLYFIYTSPDNANKKITIKYNVTYINQYEYDNTLNGHYRLMDSPTITLYVKLGGSIVASQSIPLWSPNYKPGKSSKW
jgi:hypothetical protein